MLVLFSLLIAGYFQDKKVSEVIRNLWSIKDITDTFHFIYLICLIYIFRDCFIPQYIGPNMDMVKLNSMEDMMSLPVTAWNIKQPAGYK